MPESSSVFRDAALHDTRFLPASSKLMWVERKHIDSHSVSRRGLLRGIVAGALWGPAARKTAAQQQPVKPWEPPTGFKLSKEDDQFLDDLEKANFQFFWEQGDPERGLSRID